MGQKVRFVSGNIGLDLRLVLVFLSLVVSLGFVAHPTNQVSTSISLQAPHPSSIRGVLLKKDGALLHPTATLYARKYKHSQMIVLACCALTAPCMLNSQLLAQPLWYTDTMTICSLMLIASHLDAPTS